jgi:DNA-directed RNA polymerase subunit RPC12/RpoP
MLFICKKCKREVETDSNKEIRCKCCKKPMVKTSSEAPYKRSNKQKSQVHSNPYSDGKRPVGSVREDENKQLWITISDD